MNKTTFMRGGESLPYTAPTVDLLEIDVERGFALSSTEEDWGDGSIKDDDWNNMGDF